MISPKYRARWILYLAGLTVPQILNREHYIKKHREVLVLIDRLRLAQEDLLHATRHSKTWSKELSAADAAFINLGVRRGQLS